MVPEEAFNLALDLSALGIISTWGMIVLCQIRLYRWEKVVILERPAFRLPWTPWTSYATVLFLAAVTVLMCCDNYWNLVAIVIITPMLIGRWYAVRGKVLTMAEARVGYTGEKRTQHFTFDGQKFNASADDPYWIVESAKTGARAANKESSLTRKQMN